jgi:C-terminal processing protease CtpA/Prc
MSPEIGLVAADGKSEISNLTLSGYNDFSPKWSSDGKMMIWGSDREGALQQGGGSITANVYGMFFSKEAFDRFKLTKEELALVKEREDELKKEKTDAADKLKTVEKKPKEPVISKVDSNSAVKDIIIDWANLTDRKLKLTVYTSPANDWVLSKDGEKLFYLTSFDKGNDLWVTDNRTKETKQLAKLGLRSASMELSPDGKFLFMLADGKAMKVETESGKAEPLKVSGEMVLKQADERNYIFDHAWRQLREKFYVEDLHGVDWESYYKEYKKFLPFINNNYDFSEMLSEMLGETNASHTGCRYNYNLPGGDQTAYLGLFYDNEYKAPGLRIAEVIQDGPADKASSRIKAGVIIEKIDGQVLNDSLDFYLLLNRKVGKPVLLSLVDPITKNRWEEIVNPITGGQENELLYNRWVRNRRDEVTKLSNGKIGYIHVRAMNDASMRTVFEEALGRNLDKDAVIIDTRFNGGGNIHEQLSDFLSGERYFDVVPHGQYVGYEPSEKWVKPSIVLIGESNYSDAHLFPVAYKLKGTGNTLGMPVPGTGTFVWWETQIDPTLVFGIPMGGWRTPDGKFCENNQLEPDVKVRNEPDIISTGRDQQIEAAVKELMKK